MSVAHSARLNAQRSKIALPKHAKVKPSGSLIVGRFYLFLLTLLLISAVTGLVITHEWDHYQRLVELDGALHAQQRTTLYSMTDWLEAIETDPREARSLATKVTTFAAEKQIVTRRTERIAARLPIPKPIPHGAAVIVHQVSLQPPIVVAEISVVNEVGEFIPGLSRVDFEVFNGDRRVRLVQVAQGSRFAQSQAIAVLLDCSKSMAGEPMTTAKTVADQFSREMSKGARLQLWRFSDTTTAITPWTIDSEILAHAIQPLAPDGGTALYLAIQQAARSLSQRNEARSLVVLTDGEDSANTITPQSLIDLCRQHQITLHAVALGTPKNGHRTLKELTVETDGSFHQVGEAAGLTTAFAGVMQDLRKPVYRIAILEPLDHHNPLVLRIINLPDTELLVAQPQK